MGDDLTDDLKRFISERIDSIELLEVLLALRAADSNALTVEGLSRTLGSMPRSIAGRLATLRAAGLAAEQDATWRYAPVSSELDTLVGRLERTYRERRLTVINLIYAPKPNDITLFSDAFRLRDTKKKGDQ